MANKTEYDYTDIEQPYNDDLQRGDDSLSSEVKASTEEAGDSIIESPSDVGGNVMNGSQLSNVWLNTWMKSRGYKPKTQGFLIDGTKGYIECMKLYVGSGGIIGGSLDIPDTTSANSWHVDSSGNMWIGAAAFASAPFKALNTGAVTCTDLTVTGTSTIGGRLATTIGSAIDISGDLINDVVNARINTDSKYILSDFNFGSTNYAGAVKAGDITWNTTTGAITGGSGVAIYRNGIVGAKAGVATFSINTSGDATFTGTVTATAGSIGSFSIGTYLYSGSKTAWNDANAGVHIGSDGIGVGNNVFTVNGATGAVTCSNISITGGTIQWSTVTGTGKPADNATVGATFGVNISGGSTGTNYVGNNGYITTITGSSITTGTLNASLCSVTNINASNINTGTLNASVVTVSNINASNISTGTLSADRIGATSITANKLNVTSLSSISASLGTITSGTIKVSSRVGIQKSDATAVAYLGQDPDALGIWGFIANRGYGLMCRYAANDYFRFFVDDSTTDCIIDLPAPDKLKFQDYDGNAIIRFYGGDGWGGSPGGLIDVFHPMRLYTYNYSGRTTGGPEAGSYAYDGMMYCRQNYGGSLEDNIRVYVGGSWRSVQTT